MRGGRQAIVGFERRGGLWGVGCGVGFGWAGGRPSTRGVRRAAGPHDAAAINVHSTHNGDANLLGQSSGPAQQHRRAHGAPVGHASTRAPVGGRHVAEQRGDGEGGAQQLGVTHNASHRLAVHGVQAEQERRDKRLYIRPASVATVAGCSCHAAAAGAATSSS